MSENFAALFEETYQANKMHPGAIVLGTVLEIKNDFVILNAGLKSEGYIPVSQFTNDEGNVEVTVGDEVEVAIEALEDGWGETKLSREKAKRAKAWLRLAEAQENNTTVTGIITGKVKGGFTIEVDSIRGFLPGSLVDMRSNKEPYGMDGEELEFKVIKLDQKRNNIVVSRRLGAETENSAEREALLNSLQEGQEVKGVVKNLTDYGAFVDLGGLDGLLHISDMSWKRVKQPSEVVEVGQEMQVKILKFDRDRMRVSLGLKQLGEDPWVDLTRKYPESSKLVGKVTNITDYGCFVEIEEGVEGLVHVSEMDWTNKNIHPTKVVSLGMEVEVMVLDIDEERRRISLGLKQCKENPWDAFANSHSKGDKVTGSIKSITDFGIFIGLDGDIDGLIHLSDLSWQDSGEQVVRRYKKGQEIEAVILGIDSDRERISLGVKQLDQNPYSVYISEHNKGDIVTGVVTEVEGQVATIQLADEVLGQLKSSETGMDNVNMAEAFAVGSTVESKIVALDSKNRVILLSIKAKNAQEEKEALKQVNKSSKEAKGTKLGDLFKGLSGKNSEEA